MDYTPTAVTRIRAKSLQPREVLAAVRYLEDPDEGDGRHWYAPRASVAPAGELQLKSRDTEQSFTLGMSIQSPGGTQAALLCDGKPV